jgi:hypothetical protein
MLIKFRFGKFSLISLLALTTLLVAGGQLLYQTRLPDESQIEQWGVLAGVQDEEALQSLLKAAKSGSISAARALGQTLILRTDEASVLEGQRNRSKSVITISLSYLIEIEMRRAVLELGWH